MTKWIIRESVYDGKFLDRIYWCQDGDEPSPEVAAAYGWDSSPEVAAAYGWDSSEAAITDLKSWLAEPGNEMAIWDVLPVQIEVGDPVFTTQTPEGVE